MDVLKKYIGFESLENKTILITGASGRLGKLLVDFLSEYAKPRKIIAGIYNNQPNNIANLWDEKVEVRICNLKDSVEIIRLLDKVDIVFHLAALTNAGVSKDNPTDYYAVNSFGTLNLLEACKINRVSKCIYVSTSHVYGIPHEFPVSEMHHVNPLSIYASSKFAGEIIAASYAQNFGIQVFIARISNIYGEGFGDNTAIGLAVKQALEKKVIQLKNYEVSRDFIYTADVIEALVKISCLDDCNETTEVFNVATGVTLSLRVIANTMVDIFTKMNLGDLVVSENKELITDPIPEFSIDSRKLMKRCGWSPRISIKDGLQIIIENEIRRKNNVDK